MKYSFIYFILSWIHIEMIKGTNYENNLALALCHSCKDSKKTHKKELASDISLGFRRDNVLIYLISKNKNFQFF
jgi:hypothetical protein